MLPLLYNTLLTLASPPFRFYLGRKPGLRPLLARFSPQIPALSGRPLWIHACSMGEVNTARPLVLALHQRRPDLPLLITCSTRTGMEQAQAHFSGIAGLTWFPFDHPRSVARFFDSAQPLALVLIETEIWPNIIRAAKKRQVPVLVANARLSARHFQSYRRWLPVLAPAFQGIDLVQAQTELYAERFQALGVPQERLQVAGSLKFDAVSTTPDTRERARLRALHDFSPDDKILIFGSTRPGDEKLAGDCWRSLAPRIERLRLIIAPRHRERLPQVIQDLPAPFTLRSEMLAGKGQRGRPILILDTVGELTKFYGVATVAVVGGSFFPGVEGHNPLEPAALGVPTVFGPYMGNFPEPADALLKTEGALQVSDPEALPGELALLLSDPGRCRRMGTKGRMAVLDNQGAVDRNATAILALLDKVQPGITRPPL